MPRVLIVEDSDEDTQVLMSVMEEVGVVPEVFSQPEAAVEELEKAAAGHSPLPKLIIVDLVLGRDSGFEVLRFRKSKPALMKIPVIVWTKAGGEVEEQLCRFLGVNSYVKKQQGSKELKRVLALILDSPAI